MVTTASELGLPLRGPPCQTAPPRGPFSLGRALTHSPLPKPAVHLPEVPQHLLRRRQEEEEALGAGKAQDQLASLERQVRPVGGVAGGWGGAPGEEGGPWASVRVPHPPTARLPGPICHPNCELGTATEGGEKSGFQRRAWGGFWDSEAFEPSQGLGPVSSQDGVLL